MINIKPLFNRIIAKPIVETEKTISGIQLQDDFSQTKTAQIVEISKEIEKEKDIKLGTIIYYEDHTVANILINQERYIIINLLDVLAFKNYN